MPHNIDHLTDNNCIDFVLWLSQLYILPICEDLVLEQSEQLKLNVYVLVIKYKYLRTLKAHVYTHTWINTAMHKLTYVHTNVQWLSLQNEHTDQHTYKF